MDAMGRWTFVVGCIYLCCKKTSAEFNDPNYLKGDPSSDNAQWGIDGTVCRHTDNSGEKPRDQNYHAVSFLPTIQDCKQFCDAISPCYGFEYGKNFPITKYGNCEIWFKDITRTRKVGGYHCYKKKDPDSANMTKQAVAIFSVTNLNISAIESDYFFLTAMSGGLWPLLQDYLNNDTVELHGPDPSTDILVNETTNLLKIRFTASPRGDLHVATLHNELRVLGLNQQQHNYVGWDKDLIPHTKDFITEMTEWFSNASYAKYTVGTPVVTADIITMAQLVGEFAGGSPISILQPKTTPKPGTTKKIADSAYSAQPFFLFLCLVFVQVGKNYP